MWSELLAERSDPMLRSFEIADSDGRVLLVLPFREVLESARRPKGRMPNEIQSAYTLLEKTRTLTEALGEEIKAAQATFKLPMTGFTAALAEVETCFGAIKQRASNPFAPPDPGLKMAGGPAH